MTDVWKHERCLLLLHMPGGLVRGWPSLLQPGREQSNEFGNSPAAENYANIKGPFVNHAESRQIWEKIHNKFIRSHKFWYSSEWSSKNHTLASRGILAGDFSGFPHNLPSAIRLLTAHNAEWNRHIIKKKVQHILCCCWTRCENGSEQVKDAISMR